MIVIDDDEVDSINDARWCDREEYIKQLLATLARAQKLCQIALPQFNWADSTLGAGAIRLLNEVPGEINKMLMKARP